MQHTHIIVLMLEDEKIYFRRKSLREHLSCNHMYLPLSQSLKTLLGGADIWGCSIVCSPSHAWQLPICWESYLVRFWLFFHTTFTIMTINRATLLVRIMVIGRMNDQYNGFILLSPSFGPANQQLWRENKCFQKTKKAIHTNSSCCYHYWCFLGWKRIFLCILYIWGDFQEFNIIKKWNVLALAYSSMRQYRLIDRKWTFESGNPKFKCHSLSLTRCLTIGKLSFNFIF